MQSVLVNLRDALGAIEGVCSCKIGVESNISPADYPLIRVVPSSLIPTPQYHRRLAEIYIYFGAAVSESEGLEAVYAELFALEADIIETIKAQGGKYLETRTDEDRLDTYKLMMIRCEVHAERQAQTP